MDIETHFMEDATIEEQSKLFKKYIGVVPRINAMEIPYILTYGFSEKLGYGYVTISYKTRKKYSDIRYENYYLEEAVKDDRGNI